MKTLEIAIIVKRLTLLKLLKRLLPRCLKRHTEEPMTEEIMITAKESRRLFPGLPTAQTILRWMKCGVHNRCVTDGKGKRIKLQCSRTGGRVLTTMSWIMEFQAACQANVKRS